MILEIVFATAVIAYFIFALFKFEWALTVFPLLIPFYLFRVSVAGIPLTLPEAVIYAMGLAASINFIRNNFLASKWLDNVFGKLEHAVLRKKNFFSRYKSLLIVLFLFVTAAFLSLAVARGKMVFYDGQTFEGIRAALGILKGWIIAPIILLLLYLAAIPNNNRLLDTLNFYGLSAVILSVWALFQVSTDGYTTLDARASGPFESANYLSLYIVPALIYVMIRIKELILPLSAEEKRHFWQILKTRDNVKEGHPEISLFILAFLILFLALLATKSYAGMIAAFTGTVFYFVLEFLEFRSRNKENKNPWRFIAAFLVFIVLIASVVFFIDPGKWQAMFRFDERNSSSVRMEVYEVSAGLIEENWLTGIGMGHYEAYYKQDAARLLGHEPYELNMLHPHNLFLAMWLNLGLLGLGAFIALLVLSYKRSAFHFKNFASSKINSGAKLRVLACSILTGVLIYGFFDMPFFKNDLAILFWILVAVIFASDQEEIVAV